MYASENKIHRIRTLQICCVSSRQSMNIPAAKVVKMVTLTAIGVILVFQRCKTWKFSKYFYVVFSLFLHLPAGVVAHSVRRRLRDQ